MEIIYDKVVVIIPYYQGKDFIHKCISSVLANAPVQIIVVDNDSSQATLSFQDTSVKVVKTLPGIGFGRAVNIGIHSAISLGFHKLILLNQDTLVGKGSLQVILNEITDSELKVYVPVLMDYDMQSLAKDFINRTMEIKSLNEGSFEAQKASAACMAFHKNTFQTIGYFDPFFFMYGEDDDWLTRLHSLGGKLIVLSNARVGHYNNLENPNANSKNIKRWQFRAQTILGIREERQPYLYVIKQMYRAIKYKKSSRSILDFIKLIPYISKIKHSNKVTINQRANYFINIDAIKEEI